MIFEIPILVLVSLQLPEKSYDFLCGNSPRSLCISFNEGNIPKVIDSYLVRFIWICLANQVHQFWSWLWQQSCGLKKDPRLRPRQWCEWVLFTVNDEKQKRGWRERNLEIHKIEKTDWGCWAERHGDTQTNRWRAAVDTHYKYTR